MQPFVEFPTPGQSRLKLTLNNTHGPAPWEHITNHLRLKLIEGVKNLELDVRKLPMIDSLGLGAIVGLNIAAENAGGTFRLIVERDTPIYQTLRITKLLQLVPVIEILPDLP